MEWREPPLGKGQLYRVKKDVRSAGLRYFVADFKIGEKVRYLKTIYSHYDEMATYRFEAVDRTGSPLLDFQLHDTEPEFDFNAYFEKA